MPDLWQQEQDHCLLTLLYHILSQLREVMRPKAPKRDVYATPYIEPSEHTINIGGTDYHTEITETDKVSTFTGLDDYDTLFAARHGRGALDPVPTIGDQTFTTTLGIPTPKAGPELINPMERMMPTHGEVVLAIKRKKLDHR